MKTKQLCYRIAVVSLLIVIGTSAAAQRRGRSWDSYPDCGGSSDLRQTALNAGYNAGIKQGRDDGRKGRHRNYADFGSYRDATTDYSSKLGDRELYRRYYREGFQNGYEDGYNGY